MGCDLIVIKQFQTSGHLQDNEKLITCKSGLQESKARLIIYQLDILSTSWFDNTKDKLVMMAELYPSPTVQDILWNINKIKDGS